MGHNFHIAITKESNNTYSIIALNLPGLGSCGNTLEKTMENFTNAAQDIIYSYKESGEEIPWKQNSNENVPFGIQCKWITIYFGETK